MRWQRSNAPRRESISKSGSRNRRARMAGHRRLTVSACHGSITTTMSCADTSCCVRGTGRCASNETPNSCAASMASLGDRAPSNVLSPADEHRMSARPASSRSVAVRSAANGLRQILPRQTKITEVEHDGHGGLQSRRPRTAHTASRICRLQNMIGGEIRTDRISRLTLVLMMCACRSRYLRSIAQSQDCSAIHQSSVRQGAHDPWTPR
jgi:hypothetical protein